MRPVLPPSAGALQFGHRLEHLRQTFACHGRNDNTAPGAYLDQSGGGKPAQCFAYRSPRCLEPIGDGLLLKACAGQEAAIDDLFGQTLLEKM